MTDEKTQPRGGSESRGGLFFGNSGEPILLKNVRLAGIAVGSARKGDPVDVAGQLTLISDDPAFHKIAPQVASALENLANAAGASISIDRAQLVLLVVRADNSAELWVDTAAVALLCRVKRSVLAGTPVFQQDIVDVTGMSFPHVEIGRTDRVLCLFRHDYRFALHFNLKRHVDFDVDEFVATLGTLYRTLAFRHLYDAMCDVTIFQELSTSGWFPFAEIITAEFPTLIRCVSAGFDLAETEGEIVATFDRSRLLHIEERWASRPHFASRLGLLRAALKAFAEGEPVAVIKILITEIEGVLAEAYRAEYGRSAKLTELCRFATESGERRAGRSDTLLMTSAFGEYLTRQTFAHFDPDAQDAKANSRHAVGHGMAVESTYTMTRALQVILTLDQLAFFT